MTLALTPLGLETETRQEIIDRMAARLRQRFGPNTEVTGTSLFGQLVFWAAEAENVVQQVFLALYSSFDPTAAEDVTLDARAALVGSRRKGATNSSVTGELEFSGAGTMLTGDIIKNEDNQTLWSLVDGPKTVVAAGSVAATFKAVETGPILAAAGTTWSNVTVVANLVGFTNATDDANVGRDREPNGEFRARRLRELYTPGSGPLAAIQGAVLRVDGVVFARVYENQTLTTDANGIPGKAFLPVVETNPTVPGADLQQAIWDAIWSAKGAGGQAAGVDYVGTTIDSEGTVQPSAFDGVDIVDIVMEIDLVTSTTEDPITPNLEDVVAAKVLEIAQSEHAVSGRDVKRMDYIGIVKQMVDDGEISGVDDVVVRLAIDPGSPSAVAKLAIAIRQRPDFDSANLTVQQT